MPKGDILPRIERFAHEFAEERLRPYIARISRPGAVRTSPKEINDAVWGTVKVSPLEVVVLDSPLVQRLRMVRQLGVVHWIYPSASHSRFEHTLGVLHQSQQLITAINLASGTDPGSAPIDSRHAQLVRLCALVHDIGHGVFSHVSEHALVRRTDLRLAMSDFASARKIAKVQLSEVVAHDLIGSPAFIDLLELAFDRLNQPLPLGTGAADNARRVAALVQKAIVGHHIDEQVPLLHEIITGPFDADKLDYYVRDAHHAGVPSLVDISRLLQKIVHRRVPIKDVPSDIKRAIAGGRDSCELFGLKASGAAILDELHLARVLLYSKIYRQKKVLAIEAMVDALFEALGRDSDADPVRLLELCYRFSDDQLILSDPQSLLDAAGIKKANPGLVNFVSDILTRLRDRDLFVNSLALLAKYPNDPWQEDKRQTRGLKALNDDCDNAQKVRELRSEIAAELVSLVEAVPEAVEAVPEGTLDPGVVISAKPRLVGGTQIDRALVLQGEHFVRGRDMDRINQPAWADAYNFGSPQAHVFTPQETSLATYVAAERLIRRKYGVVLPQSAVGLSKQDAEAVNSLKHELEAKRWYAGVSMDIRPKPRRLERADVSDRLEALAHKLKVFDEPIATEATRRLPALRERIVSWLAQFRDDDVIEDALSALEQLKVLSREDTYEALRSFVKAHPEFEGATICPLGDLKDSGTVQAYLSQDLQDMFTNAMTVQQAAERSDGSPIIFIDDLVCSGTQVQNMIGSWFDDDDLKAQDLGERRFPYQEKERTFLTSRPVAFVFVAGWSTGLERVSKAAEKVGIDATIHAHLHEADLPFAFQQNSPSDGVNKFEEACRSIGEALLASNGKPPAKQRERALGYGNRAMLLATRLNVPTQTLTCLWMDGQHDGVDWHALMHRRTKA